MDWERYKQICDRPDVFSRWMLEQTRELLDASHAELLDSALAAPALDKPPDHRGGAATDMYELALEREAVIVISARVAAAVDRGLYTSATRARGLGGFREAWMEYAAYVSRPQQYTLP